MQNGVTFPVEMTPKSTSGEHLAGLFTYDREKCKTVLEATDFLPHVRFRTFHLTALKQAKSQSAWAISGSFPLKT